MNLYYCTLDFISLMENYNFMHEKKINSTRKIIILYMTVKLPFWNPQDFIKVKVHTESLTSLEKFKLVGGGKVLGFSPSCL